MDNLMTATPAKFTFDLDMGHRAVEAQTITDERLQGLLDAARREGFEAGRIEGEKTELARSAQALQASGEALGQQTAKLLSAFDNMRKQTLGDAVALSQTISKKLAIQLIEREPVAELQPLIAECMASIDKAPHLVIRCHPDTADAVRDVAEQHMNTSGFEGRLVIMGEPDIALGDGRVEWVDGGIERNSETISNDIDKAIADYLKASGIEAPKEGEQ